MSKYIKKTHIKNTLRIPIEGKLDLTYRCNNDCRHCWVKIPKDSRKKDELTFEEIKKIIEEARNMGCRKWSISGGEPMLRPDFPEIFDYITRRSNSFSLNTNGSLITPEIAKLMKRKGTKMVAIYGATAEVHDHITRSPGSFEKTLQGIAYLNEAGTSFTIQVVPMRDNFHQYIQMTELAKSLSSDWRVGASWLYLSACRDPEKNNEIIEQRLSPQEIINFEKPSLENENLNNKEINSQSNSGDDLKLFSTCIEQKQDFHIDPYGQMSFCSYIKDPGLRYDLKKGNFGDCWENFIPSLKEKVEGSKEYMENCYSCDLRADCKWCPVYGFLEHGRMSAKIEYLCGLAKETRKFKNQYTKNHKCYFRIAGITIEVNSDLPINESTFHPKFKHFEVKGRGEENISLWHHFSPLNLDNQELGEEVFRHPPWVIYKKESGWVYKSQGDSHDKNRYFQLATFTNDYSLSRIHHDSVRKNIFNKGNLESLSLFPSDPFWLAQVMANKNGGIFHSSGVIRNGNGLLFIGHSGAGKSTITKLIKDKVKILCDDKIIVREWPDGFKIHGTWSHGELPDISPDDAPLKAIFFLEKSTENKLEKPEKAETLKRLLACLMKPYQTAEWWEKELIFIERIISEVPCYILHFNKSGKVWDILTSL